MKQDGKLRVTLVMSEGRESLIPSDDQSLMRPRWIVLSRLTVTHLLGILLAENGQGVMADRYACPVLDKERRAARPFI
ncbi:hypothetical protein FBY04_106270 [Pseudomonas sp. SJZ080]|nr:hypothetical protein FBY04_106270 [Pseudomonas sp. SJZ080]